MSFTTACPNCDARLQAPDTVEGKRVKCKKCGDAFVARPLDDDPPPRSAAKSRPRRDEEDEDRPRRSTTAARRSNDDDYEDDDRPRRRSRDDDEDEPRRPRKKGRKKAAGPPVLLFVLLGVGALVLLGAIAFGAYWFLSGDTPKDNPVARGGAAAGGPGGPVGGGGGAVAGWVDFAEPAGRFRVKMPQRPRAPITQRQQLPNGEQTEIRMHPAESAGEVFMVGHVNMPAAAAGAPADAILDGAVEGGQFRSKGAVLRSKSPITFQGFPGREAVLEFPGKRGSLVLRVILANNRMIMMIAAGDTVSAGSPKVRGFFESLRIE
jgi:hypothetical protein